MDSTSQFTFIEGKRCIFHDGLAVIKHSCGEYLCKECVRDLECPKCHEAVRIKKKSPAKVAPVVKVVEKETIEEPATIEVAEPRVAPAPPPVKVEKKVEVPKPLPPPPDDIIEDDEDDDEAFEDEDDEEEDISRPMKKKDFFRL